VLFFLRFTFETLHEFLISPMSFTCPASANEAFDNVSKFKYFGMTTKIKIACTKKQCRLVRELHIVTANKCSNFFPGNQPHQHSVKNQRFGNWLCLHHQGRCKEWPNWPIFISVGLYWLGVKPRDQVNLGGQLSLFSVSNKWETRPLLRGEAPSDKRP
jgi:hypothetical protein